ncbi:MAG: hypothetical protein O7E56_10770 [SAR324 cluster bacterium]|nr:hypothetical protein [SAR324 cluster bacterium]MCZ6628697.1 hypothetical protein [SAR324 cluster bacterium]MCZ6841205.1 hypothetical protein [SAR324 cluster bacterium]
MRLLSIQKPILARERRLPHHRPAAVWSPDTNLPVKEVRTLTWGLREEGAPPGLGLTAIVEEIIGAAEAAQIRYLN